MKVKNMNELSKTMEFGDLEPGDLFRDPDIGDAILMRIEDGFGGCAVVAVVTGQPYPEEGWHALDEVYLVDATLLENYKD